jgi:hypothetical protein
MWKVLPICAVCVVCILTLMGCGADPASSPTAASSPWHERLSPEATALKEYSVLMEPAYTAHIDVLKAHPRVEEAWVAGNAAGVQTALNDGVAALKETRAQLADVMVPSSAPVALSDLQERWAEKADAALRSGERLDDGVRLTLQSDATKAESDQAVAAARKWTRDLQALDGAVDAWFEEWMSALNAAIIRPPAWLGELNQQLQQEQYENR